MIFWTCYWAKSPLEKQMMTQENDTIFHHTMFWFDNFFLFWTELERGCIFFFTKQSSVHTYHSRTGRPQLLAFLKSLALSEDSAPLKIPPLYPLPWPLVTLDLPEMAPELSLIRLVLASTWLEKSSFSGTEGLENWYLCISS